MTPALFALVDAVLEMQADNEALLWFASDDDVDEANMRIGAWRSLWPLGGGM